MYLAGIFAFFSAGAEESLMEFEFVTQSGPAQFGLARDVVHHWHIDFFENVLVATASAETVLAPSGHPAASAGKLLIPRWQTGGSNVRTKRQ